MAEVTTRYLMVVAIQGRDADQAEKVDTIGAPLVLITMAAISSAGIRITIRVWL